MSHIYAQNYKGFDYFNIDDLLSETHLSIRKAVRDWVNQEIIPVIDDCAQNAIPPQDILKKLGSIGVLGSMIPAEYGGGGLDYMAYGIMMQELERGDSAIRSSASVQSSLVIYPIYKFGSEEQKRKFLPQLCKGELIGSFGLTEPNHGSNPSGMETHVKKADKGYILNGTKSWITHAPVCDLAVIWAKNEEGKVLGIIVERGMKGFTTPTIKNKWSLRASETGELVFQDVFIPEENVLPIAQGLKAPLTCLTSARYGISWGAIGAAMDCLHCAVEYSKDRLQFEKPIASFQLTQKKLAEMLTAISQAQLMSFRLAQLMDSNSKAISNQVSMAKRNNVAMALEVARTSRQILGANGISGDFPIMRHSMNLESVVTYEGTHEIHLLITGMDITGINAFS